MMSDLQLPSTLDPQSFEAKWYNYWLEQGCFRSTPDERPSYTIVIPPPNVTGVLHMGHMLNNTIQDILVRKARMLGYNACWVPGTDHASIATEAKVVAMLREQGIKKSELGREEFLAKAFEWKEKYGGIILHQLKKLGASCDWDRTAFTMDEDYYKAVIRVFVDFYKKGYIYRGLRMINWDCEAQTALSNEEVVYKEEGEKAIMYSVRYKLEGSDDEWLTIATQRPETIMGDVAIAVNPNDGRYKHLHGKRALVPFINRAIPIIADDYVDIEFGTGCLKVTPAHDVNDYEIGQRHNLEVIDTINLDGTLNEKCEMPEYVGMDRFVVRKKIAKKLEEAGHLVATEEVVSRIGRSERTNTVVEPKLSLQWFIKMKDISAQALAVVEHDEVQLHPAKFKNTYRHWMENVRDWCISRQLWWGHRIPAYYYGTGDEDFVVANNMEEALELARAKSGNAALQATDLKQDEDVLDTWASSWLWPVEVFGGISGDGFDPATGKIDLSKNPELAYYYPTQVLVTAPEILFFWVARMIIAGMEYVGKPPFKDVYLTGIVRDKLGRKMSKSLGNSPDPEELMRKYGADGVRTGMLFSSPAGNDLPFDEKLCEQGRNFSNKIWNAFRLLQGLEVADIATPEVNQLAGAWFQNRLNLALAEIDDHFSKYRISDALRTVYKLIWDDYCSWYLEWIKPAYQSPIDKATLDQSMGFMHALMRVLHPFMPFLTEEVYQYLTQGKEGSIMNASWPQSGSVDMENIKAFEQAAEIVVAVRNARAQYQISPKETLTLGVKLEAAFAHSLSPMIYKLANLQSISSSVEAPAESAAFMAAGMEFYLSLEGRINKEEELKKAQEELAYTQGFLATVMKKVGNEKFMAGAPEAVKNNELKKKADAEEKIRLLEERIAKLLA